MSNKAITTIKRKAIKDTFITFPANLIRFFEWHNKATNNINNK